MTTTRPVALVTGASSGIGQAAAVAHIDAGVQVVGTSRDASRVAVRDRVTFLDLDVACDESASTAVERVIAPFGQIDVPVNNAGVGSAGAAAELSVAQNRRVFDVNVFGVIRMTNAVLPHMRAQGGGRVITISSTTIRFDGDRVQTDTPIPVYVQQRRDFDELMATAMKGGGNPAVVDKVIVAAATCTKPKLRCTAGPQGRPRPHAAPHRSRPGLRQANPQDQPPGRLMPSTISDLKTTDQEISMNTSSRPASGTETSYIHARTRTVDVNGTRFAYRQLGPDSGTPVILLNHLGGNLDNWDPRVVDGLTAEHRVITFDNRGVGASEGSTPTTIAAMAGDAVSFVRALGFDRVDLVGFSLGGFITQVITQEEPQLVRRIVLAGTGPAGGEGIDKVTSITIKDMIRAALTFSDPKRYLFFTQTANGKQAAKDFLARLKERTDGRDAAISPVTFRAQLKATHAWGRQQPADLARIVQPALVVNGDADRMVPSSNTVDLARRLPNSELEIYPDAGHGGAFQYHDAFVTRVLQFLQRT